MPITVYVDGSGMHDDSDILTLAAYVMESRVIEPFNQRWSATLKLHKMTALHMRQLDLSAGGTGPLICDLLNVLSGFSQEFQYLRTCSIVMEDYKKATLGTDSMKPAQLLCVDFCVGGLSIPKEDLGKHDVVTMKFDQGEPFQNYVYRVWQEGRKGSQGGWPRQVQEIQPANSALTPGLQVADLFAWALNRQNRRLDQPLLASASFLAMRHAACSYRGDPDFAPRRCSWSTSGRLVCDR